MPYDNTNSGILARNQRKQQDSHPDFSGSINIEGVEYWLSGWTKEGKAGSKLEGQRYFSLSVKPKEVAAPPAPAARPAPKLACAPLDDDIPF